MMGMTPYSICVALSALVAMLLMQVLRRRTLREGTNTQAIEAIGKIDLLTLALWCLPAGLVGARLLYCLFRFEFYAFEVGAAGVLRTWEGGFLLYGAAAGVMLAAAALARRRCVRPALVLDELAAPGMLAIVICRMAECLTSEGVGPWMENELFCRFPFATCNEYGEWQLAVFVLEAFAAAVIFAYVLRLRCASGEKILTALLLYAGCQVVLESLRVDSCLRLGFVRVSQVLSGVVILGVTMIRARSVGRKQMLIDGGICVVCMAAAGVIEWALDKTPVNNALLYGAMAAVCAVMIANAMRRIKREDM